MQTADFNHEDFEANSQSRMDEGLLVKFYPMAIEDKAETRKQGRPCFKDVDICEIRVPGSKDFVAHPVNQNDLNRFPRHWAAYQNRTQNDEKLEGTLLSEWPLIVRSQVEALGFSNIKTVEQLVATPDSNISLFMGGYALKQKAKEWLVIAEEGKAKAELKAELDKRDVEINELKAQMAQLMKPKRRVTKKKAARKKVSAKKE